LGGSSATISLVILAAPHRFRVHSDDSAHPAGLQQGLVDGEIGQVGHDLVALGLAHLLGLLLCGGVEGQRRIVGIAGEGVWRQCVR